MAYSNCVAPSHADWGLFLIGALQRPNILSITNKTFNTFFLKHSRAEYKLLNVKYLLCISIRVSRKTFLIFWSNFYDPILPRLLLGMLRASVV